MNCLRLVLAAFVVGGLALTVGADEKKPDKDNAKLLVGAWEAVKVDKEAGLPEGAVADFSKDGKLKVTFKDKDGKEQTMEGTYKVDGDKFTITMKNKDGEEKKKVINIKKISDDACTTTDEDGKAIEWKKKKS